MFMSDSQVETQKDLVQSHDLWKIQSRTISCVKSVWNLKLDLDLTNPWDPMGAPCLYLLINTFKVDYNHSYWLQMFVLTFSLDMVLLYCQVQMLRPTPVLSTNVYSSTKAHGSAEGVHKSSYRKRAKRWFSFCTFSIQCITEACVCESGRVFQLSWDITPDLSIYRLNLSCHRDFQISRMYH